MTTSIDLYTGKPHKNALNLTTLSIFSKWKKEIKRQTI